MLSPRTPALGLLLSLMTGILLAQFLGTRVGFTQGCILLAAPCIPFLLLSRLRPARWICLLCLSLASGLSALARESTRPPFPLSCEERAVIVARSREASAAGGGASGNRVRAVLVAAWRNDGARIHGCGGSEAVLSLDGSYAPREGELFAVMATFLGWQKYHNGNLTPMPLSRSEILGFKGYIRDLLVFEGGGGPVSGLLGRVRSGLSAEVKPHLGERTSDFLAAILFGERSTLGWREKEALRRSGAYHVLSISGTHISLLAIVCMTLLSGCGLSKETSMRLVIVLLLVYVVLVGASPPAVRAFLMVAAFSGSLLLQRFASSLNALAVAALLILLASPDELAQPGFQLSFSAVAGLLIVGEGAGAQRAGRLHFAYRVLQSLFRGILMSLSAFLAQVPTMVFFFSRLYPVTIVSNIAIIPLVGLILPLGIAFTALSLASAGLAKYLAPVLDAAVNALFATAGIFARAEPFPAGRSDLLALTAASAGGLLFLARVPARLAGMCLLSALTVLVTIAILPEVRTCPRGTVRVAFLDVGEGDSSVIEFGVRRVVIDTGETGASGRGSQLGEYLEARGARCVDFLILSHPHDDHFGDAVEILERVHVGAVVGTEPAWKSTGYARLLEKIRALRIPYYIPATGDTLSADGVCLFFFNPAGHRGARPTENDFSLAVKFLAGDLSVLYPGDAQASTERKLMEVAPRLLPSRVLKLGHHGSKTSTGPRFLSLVNPRIAVISCERAGRFGHPSGEVVDRLVACGSTVYRTDVHGGVLIEYRDGSLEVSTALSGPER